MDELFDQRESIIQPYRYFEDADVQVDIKREDLLHPQVSGNKMRKLKYNLITAHQQGHDTILTYGGAFSNHIAATAAAGKITGLRTIGIIRGDELGRNLEKTLAGNSTLRTAAAMRMDLHFVDRDTYKEKDSPEFQLEMEKKFGRFYHIPEGGSNELAVRGCAEILSQAEVDSYNLVTVAAGTGGTAAGIINSAGTDLQVIVFGALKGDFLIKDIENLSGDSSFEFYDDSIFGGYARSSDQLIEFLNVRFRESGIPLEPIYTGKMMYGLEELIANGHFPRGTRILAIHTGGLQSIHGYNERLRKKGRVLLQYESELS